MKDYLIKLGNFILGFIAINLVVFILFHFLAIDTRLATTWDKEQRLLDTSDNRRIILIGGSNLQYGLNSELMATELDLEVVNMGVQASLGLDFMFGQVENSLNNKDVVVLSLEPALLGNIPTYGKSTIIKLFFLRPPLVLKYFRTEHLEMLVIDYPVIIKDFIQNCIVSVGRLVFDKPGFRTKNNKYGDYLGHQDRDRTWVSQNITSECFNINENNLHRLKQFEHFCIAKGISVYFSWAPIAKSRLPLECKKSLMDFEENGNIVGLISPIEKMTFADSLFYDTPHHLRYAFINYRTEKIIQELRKNEL